ncbi:hypothetical protein FXE78_13350 [Vibrio mimicus]|nr:hypothetical protein FXE78_13350 [Vibrio mimicus]
MTEGIYAKHHSIKTPSHAQHILYRDISALNSSQTID